MKKVLPKILICINITVIVLLLLFSGVFLYFTSSPSIFGHAAFLYENDTENPKSSLLLIEQKPKEILIGDKVTFYSFDNDNKTQHIKLVSSIDDVTLSFENSDIKVDMDSDLFIGKIVNDNVFWGGIISSLVKNKHTKLIYILSIAGFLIISLSILLVSIIIKKKNAISNIIKKDRDDDIVLEDIDQDENISEEYIEDIEEQNTEDILIDENNISLSGLRIVYRDEIIHNVDENFKESNLPVKKPLYEALLDDFYCKPVNIGTSKKEKIELITKKDDEVDLSKLYDVVEQTNELEINYIQEENDIIVKSEEEDDSIDECITEDENETFDVEENILNISIDNILDDIISKVESEINNNL